jgi:hypothetical protein
VSEIVPAEKITTWFYPIRNIKVMLDRDLAELYEIETKTLKRKVRRNSKKFPSDFMFELTDQEFRNLRSQFVMSGWEGVRRPPMAFTEQGIAMLLMVLNRDRNSPFNITRKHSPITETFFDVLKKNWDKAKNHLTPKQQHWCEMFLALKKPTPAAVARILNISRAASSKMKLRLLTVLLPYYQSFLDEQEDDKLLETITLKKQEHLLENPEYIERRRGQSHYMHWRAEKVYHERLGKSLTTGRIGKQVKNTLELQKLKDLPIRHTSTHKASPLSLWWVARVEEEMSQKNTDYTATYEKLYAFYWAKWPEKARKELDCLCRFCRSLLPLGEIVGGRKITKRRRYCSDSCKTYFKRHRLTSFKKY